MLGDGGAGMAIAWGSLAEVYIRLIGGIGVGMILGRVLPGSVPKWVGWFLFWIGVPITSIAFLRRVNLVDGAAVAVGTAWLGIAIAGVLLLGWFKGTPHGRALTRLERGSLVIATLFGNTGYVGYPVVLMLVGGPGLWLGAAVQ